LEPIGSGLAGPLQFDPFDVPHRVRDRRPVAAPALSPISFAGTAAAEAPLPAYTLPPLTSTEPPAAPQAISFQDRVMSFERSLIDEAMHISGNHQGKAAEHLELTYHQFRGLMRKHGLKK